MSKTDQDGSSTEEQRPSFSPEDAEKHSEEAWRSRREQALRRYGLWDIYKSVPPVERRDEPFETYLPGGSNYDG